MRRPEFNVRTDIERVGDRTVVRRVAVVPDARPFLERIPVREARAADFFGAAAHVVRGRAEGAAIEYPFVPHGSLEDRVVDALERGDLEGCAANLERYVAFLDGLPGIDTHPQVFAEYTGASVERCRCFAKGPADCIPRNILVDDEGDWHVIDHEWMMDFPIPVDWVLYRGIYSLIYSLQPQIRRVAGAACPVEIVAGRWGRLVAPTDWVEVLDRRSIPVETLEDWYFGWQRQILVDPVPRPLRPWRQRFAQVPGRWNPRALASDLRSILRNALRQRQCAAGVLPGVTEKLVTD